jgi:hypothetical protein
MHGYIDIMPQSDPIEKNLEAVGAGLAPKKGAEREPLYRMLGDSKIPVSKALGVVWESRRDQGLSARKNIEPNWDEALRYYDNDQTAHRSGGTDISSGNQPGTRLTNEWRETENVVFANCSIMVPMLYAKNPNITISHTNDANEMRAKCVQRLVNKLLAQKTSPGLNFKPIARRAVLVALLTNSAFIKIGFTDKQDSSEEAVAELQRLSVKLEQASKKKEILEVEGELQALEEKIAMLTPSGPWTRNLMPHRVVIDPSSAMPDGSDANWMMEWDYLPTSYINAVYGKRHGEETRSVYAPTHVLDANTKNETLDDTVNNFSLFNQEDVNASANGYSNAIAYKSAQHTKVWYIWDKVTRRVLLYADNNWKWPLWVWDDPLKLPRFFPYFRLWFHEAANTNAPKGEVTYYLDQQDAINEIASEVRRGRQWARRNVLYNKDVFDSRQVEDVLKGDDGTARGISLPEGSKIQDHIFSFVPPAFSFPEFFSPDSKFAAINRITGVNDAMRGAQFKTNTTNKAIEQYQANVDVRVDERVDLIEDFIGDIAWNIAMLCMMKWEKEDVAPIVGVELAEHWQKVNDPREFETNFAARVEGGSTAKPNSREKKQQALEIGQVIGQFANAAPAAVIVMLKMFERSFDEFVVNDEEWQMIMQTMMQSLQKAGGGPGSEGQGQDQQDPNTAASGTPVTDEGLQQQIRQRIAALPPAAQQKLEQLVQAGTPPSDALKQIEAELSQKPQ